MLLCHANQEGFIDQEGVAVGTTITGLCLPVMMKRSGLSGIVVTGNGGQLQERQTLADQAQEV